jgi:hypothetical protein
MKTRRRSRKVTRRAPDDHRDTRAIHRNPDTSEFEAEEKLAENHFLSDEEWSPPKKSKGADEEL